MANLKNKFHYYLAEKNWGVKREYIPYITTHKDKYEGHRIRRLWLLFRLNWHYRILRNKEWLVLQESLSIYPYSEGAESGKRKASAYHFAVPLMDYDVISFDIFDTLILRKMNTPDDVFMLVGKELQIFDFYNIRKKAELDVRQKQKASFGDSETTLDEIYERVAYYTGIDSKVGAELEFEIEKKVCIANPFMLRVFEILKAAGKRIFVTSNMYIPKDKMQVLLEGCGFSGFEDILVSCDYHCSKNNGALFRVLLSKIEDKTTVVHIGDNSISDIKGAKSIGLEPKYYAACCVLGNPYRSKGFSPLICGAYCGLVNSVLHNGSEIFSKLWEFGFVYGGLAALGYVHWLHRQALSNGITKILFLSRDCFVLKKVYDMFFDDIPSEYVYWSRIAALRNVAVGDRDPFLNRFIGEKCNKGVTIYEALKTAGLEDFVPKLKKIGLEGNYPLVGEDKIRICDFLVENWNEVELAFNFKNECMLQYLNKAVGEHKNIGVVDLGWSGRTLYLLTKLLQNKINVENVHGFLMGSWATKDVQTLIMQKNIQCYMCDVQNNRNILGAISKDKAITSIVIEQLFSASHPSFIGFYNDGEMEFNVPEIENYSAYTEIGNGIIDFCKKYNEYFSSFPYLYEISGSDAYAPLSSLLDAKNKSTVLKYLIGDLQYNVGISAEYRKISSLVGGKK